MSRIWKQELDAAVSGEDHATFLAIARERPHRVVRFLNSRLYSGDDRSKRKTIKALGVLVGQKEIMDHQRVTDLLRRFAWALNDESGAVPFGVPEAIGEVLAVRQEFQPAFLPILCSLLTEEEMCQTGPIERGALWAVGRVGAPAGEYSREVVEAVRMASERHPEAETREVACRTLEMITGKAVSR